MFLYSYEAVLKLLIAFRPFTILILMNRNKTVVFQKAVDMDILK